MEPLVIKANWDPEAEVWVAESEVLGLITEAPTLDALRAKLPDMIADLLEEWPDDQRRKIPPEFLINLIAHAKMVLHRPS